MISQVGKQTCAETIANSAATFPEPKAQRLKLTIMRRKEGRKGQAKAQGSVPRRGHTDLSLEGKRDIT